MDCVGEVFLHVKAVANVEVGQVLMRGTHTDAPLVGHLCLLELRHQLIHVSQVQVVLSFGGVELAGFDVVDVGLL